MLPPGHVAGGYLTAFLVIKAAGTGLTANETTGLLALGAVAAFIPDLDFFYAFYKTRSFTIQNNSVNHRLYITHTPVFWITAGLAIYLLGPNQLYQLAAVTLVLGALSHLALDSIQHGVMWLWPFSKRRYALAKSGGMSPGITEPNFFKFWWKAVWQYPKQLPYTFAAEIMVIITALIILIK